MYKGVGILFSIFSKLGGVENVLSITDYVILFDEWDIVDTYIINEIV